MVAGVRGVTGPCVSHPPAGQLGLVCPAEMGAQEVGYKTSHGLGLEQGHLFHHMLLSKASPDPRRAGQTPPGIGRHDTVTLQRVRLEEGGGDRGRLPQGG